VSFLQAKKSTYLPLAKLKKTHLPKKKRYTYMSIYAYVYKIKRNTSPKQTTQRLIRLAETNNSMLLMEKITTFAKK